MIIINKKPFIALSCCEQNKESRHESAHRLLAAVLKEYFDLNEYEIVRDDRGKPYLKDSPLYISLSHTKDMVCAGVADSLLGVDIEKLRPCPEKIISRVFSEEEKKFFLGLPADEKDREFFRLWTLKESFVKMTGQGISYGMSNISFEPPEEKDFHYRTFCYGSYVISAAYKK
jgi:4'-phosphopantetheinyl transferase